MALRADAFGLNVPLPPLHVADVGLQGCTPGYWKNHPQAWGCGYTPTTKFFDVFMVITNRRGLPANLTLMEAVSLGGGEYKALVRHAVAALLNACHSNVDYPYTGTQIISTVVSMFNSGSAILGGKNYSGVEALKDELDRANNLGCPLNNSNYMTLLGGVRENNEPGSEMVTVTTSPNPFSDVVRFSILSNYTGKAELKLLNMTGQPIATVFRGTVEANKQQVVEYKANKLLPQNLLYTLKFGDKQVTGKLFRAPKN